MHKPDLAPPGSCPDGSHARETASVRSFIQTTAAVEPARALEFWRDTALAMTGAVDAERDERPSFAASRLVGMVEGTTLLHTRSAPIGIERTAESARRAGRDDVTLAVLLRGSGYFEQAGEGGLVAPGDISIVTTDRPYAAGGDTHYEEIRLIVPRAAFRMHVGDPEAFTARLFGAGARSEVLTTSLRAYASSIAGLSGTEASHALEGILHLAGSLSGAPEGTVSAEALRNLAIVRIARRLRDPRFGPEALAHDLGISRTRLYAAFSDGMGVAAAIRDARLDRSYRLLCAPEHAGETIANILHACGFTDASTFSHSFRRRFGLSARAIRGSEGIRGGS